MELTTLEKRFFDEVLRLELDVPVNATLTIENESIEMIVVPEITGDRHLKLKYFNAAPFRPEPQNGVSTFVGSQMFGVHPTLEKAWFEDEVVKVTLKKSMNFPPRESTFDIKAQVLYAESAHKGGLVLDRNIVELDENGITEAGFDLMNFPDFKCGNSFPDPQVFDKVQSLVDTDMPDGWSINIKQPPDRILLDGNEGWSVALTKEETETRGLINHNGVIAFDTGSAFSADTLTEILTGAGTFFAFVAGHHCFPTVVVGYNEQKRPVWGRVGRFPEVQRKSLNWFVNSHDVPQGAYLERLFPKFWAKWKVKDREISEAIDLYLRSAASRQTGNPIGAIVESYAGLETLASLVLGKTIQNGSASEIHKALKIKGVPLRCVKELTPPVFLRISNRLNDKSGRGISLIEAIRHYGHHPLKIRTEAEIKPDLHAISQHELSSLAYLHDLCQFYFEHLFLAYCGFGDTAVKTDFGRFRPLLAELNTV